MPEFLAPLGVAASAEGIWLLVFGLVLGGLVRGFAGFGTAMIYMPFAAQVLSPFEALTSLVVEPVCCCCWWPGCAIPANSKNI